MYSWAIIGSIDSRHESQLPECGEYSHYGEALRGRDKAPGQRSVWLLALMPRKQGTKTVQPVRTSPDTDPELLSSERPHDATPEHSEGQIETLKDPGERTGEQPTKGWQGGPAIDIAIKQQIAERLKQDPLLNYSELALELGVSDDVVGRIARKVADGDSDLGDKRMRSFQRQIGKELPVSERVRKYAQVVRGEVDAKGAFSVLSALKRIEELEGQVTAKERRESADNSVPKLPAMFVMPANTDVDIGVAIKVRARKS